MNKQVNHPYIDLAGILHIALVVNDVHEAMQAWSEWTGIEQSAMNLRLRALPVKTRIRAIISVTITSMVQPRITAFGRRMSICRTVCGLS